MGIKMERKERTEIIDRAMEVAQKPPANDAQALLAGIFMALQDSDYKLYKQANPRRDEGGF